MKIAKMPKTATNWTYNAYSEFFFVLTNLEYFNS